MPDVLHAGHNGSRRVVTLLVVSVRTNGGDARDVHLKLYEMCISNNMRCASRAAKTIGLVILSGSVAADKYLLFVRQGSGKEIRVSSFGQFQPFAQFGNGGGKVAYGEVRLFLGSQHLFHFFLAEAAGGGDSELAAGEVGKEAVRSVEVAVGMQLFNLI